MKHRDDDPAEGGGDPPPDTDATYERYPGQRSLAGRSIGRYRLIARIGEGSGGAVYRGYDRSLRRPVAVKLIPAETLVPEDQASEPLAERELAFQSEALLATLQHPNIVTLYDAGCDGGFYYLTMELVEGDSLASELRRLGRLPVDRVIWVGMSVGGALAFAHSMGVIHCDIKPSNLLLSGEDILKVTDFGVARLMRPGQATYGPLGTPAYAAPEQCLGKEIDGRADLFSLGCVLYECASGVHPFRAGSIPETEAAILSSEPRPLVEIAPGVPPVLSRIIARTLAKDPEERFQTAGELVAALTGLVREVGARRMWMGRRRLLAIGATGLGLLGIGIGIGWLEWDGTLRDWLEDRRIPPGNDAPGSDPAGSSKVTFGVTLFDQLTEVGEIRWMREALRETFNTELSQLASAKVYSREFLDFMIQKKGLSEIEAMSELKIQKMLSGSFTVVDEELRITTTVVDVATGVVDTAWETRGSPSEFFNLRRRIVLEAIERLGLPVSERERERLVRRPNPSVKSFQRFLAAERGGREEKPAKVEKDRSSRLLFPKIPLPFFPSTAYASGEGAEDEIRALLERYRIAMERADVDSMSSIYLDYDADAREAQRDYFETVRDLHVQIADVEIAVAGDSGVVSYTRTDEFVDAESGETIEMVVRLTKALEKTPGGWRMQLGN